MDQRWQMGGSHVSSTAKRDDGSSVPRPSLQGAVTAYGRFHLITTRTDAPKYASGDRARLPRRRLWPSPRDRSPTRALIRWTKARKDPRKYRHEHVSKSCRSSESAANLTSL